MVNIPNPHKKVPMMFQAQIGGRCQLNYIDKNADQSDIERWTSEWLERADSVLPNFAPGVETKAYQINWRFVTNGGQDDGIIRPVLGAKGIPFYPGSSMKGAFAQACTSEEERHRYCGYEINSKDMAPGILRFHGGYPTNNQWQEKLIDIVHPQQQWQVKNQEKEGGAFPLISLYKPELYFGISSTIPLVVTEWEAIWNIWEKALSLGIGCRVSAGYGQPKKFSGKIIYSTVLEGRGIASKLLNNTAEFRPNLFKASIRGHALRIFGGLTDSKTAEKAVEGLFGGIQGDGGTVGLLSMRFTEKSLDIGTFGIGNWQVPTYQVQGTLSWLVTESLSDEKRQALQILITLLTRFSMVLGGFGRSWRRADHRLFYEEYYQGLRQKPLIGCHWQWQGDRALLKDVSVRKIEQLGPFINTLRDHAQKWLIFNHLPIDPTDYAKNWREAWHPNSVQVWGRLTEYGADDSLAIRWLHQSYRKANPPFGIAEGSIYKSSITGEMSRIGCLWHRMYPVVRLLQNKEDASKKIGKATSEYLEFLTIFPDASRESSQFLEFLKTSNEFQLLWPIATDDG